MSDGGSEKANHIVTHEQSQEYLFANANETGKSIE